MDGFILPGTFLHPLPCPRCVGLVVYCELCTVAAVCPDGDTAVKVFHAVLGKAYPRGASVFSSTSRRPGCGLWTLLAMLHALRHSLRLANCTGTVPALVFASLEAGTIVNEAVRQVKRLLYSSPFRRTDGTSIVRCHKVVEPVMVDGVYSVGHAIVYGLSKDIQPHMRHLRRTAEVFDFSLVVVGMSQRRNVAPRCHTKEACAPAGTCASMGISIVAPVLFEVMRMDRPPLVSHQAPLLAGILHQHNAVFTGRDPARKVVIAVSKAIWMEICSRRHHERRSRSRQRGPEQHTRVSRAPFMGARPGLPKFQALSFRYRSHANYAGTPFRSA